MYRNMLTSEMSTFDMLADIAADLETLFSDDMSFSIEPDMFTTFSATPDTCSLGAVDGSSTIVMKGPNFIVGAYRSAALVFNGHTLSDSFFSTPAPVLINTRDMKDIYSNAFTDFVGVPPVLDVREPDMVLQRLRVMEEMKLVARLVDELAPGGIILVDGSLRSTVNRLDAFMEEIFQRALSRNISVVGISKLSSLSLGRTPIIPYVQYEAERMFSEKMWCLDIEERMENVLAGQQSHLFGNVNVVKFNPFSQFVFRTDILTGEKKEVVLRKVANFCKDPSYLGYPYPLAKVHNEVVITRGTREDMYHELKNTAMKRGMKAHEWRYLSQDFHDILDRGV